MGKWLYRMEARGIQRWILASDRLRELMGGSAIVEGLAQEAEKVAAGVGGRKILGAAGGITLSFDSEVGLQAFVAHWPMTVERRAPGLPLCHAWVPEDQSVRLFDLLADMTPSQAVDLPEAGPLLARAGRTGLPAVRRGEKDGDEDRATRAKVVAAQAVGDLLGGRLLEDELPGRAFIEDIDDFGEGYIAVVHADGNAVGKAIRALGGDLDRLKKLSEALSGATLAAAKAAVGRLVVAVEEDGWAPPGAARGALPARPIVLGGDDLTVIIHARYALPFTHFYLTRFGDEVRKRAGDVAGLADLTASAGIALVKPGWPFHAAHSLAESLCRAAKDELKPRAGLLFHRVTTAMSDLSWREVVERELLVEDEGSSGRILSGGPYALEELPRLERLAEITQDMPRGALRGWLTEVKTSVGRAQARWERMEEVARAGTGGSSPQAWGQLANALGELGVDAATGWSAVAARSGLTTPIPDALTWATIQPARTARLWEVTP